MLEKPSAFAQKWGCQWAEGHRRLSSCESRVSRKRSAPIRGLHPNGRMSTKRREYRSPMVNSKQFPRLSSAYPARVICDKGPGISECLDDDGEPIKRTTNEPERRHIVSQ